ncbi:MAG: hypothetical protein KJ607_07015 [Bacteroidetes bacterium]|nr:hypothetical protein [Bacteroidota bacterium]
MHGRKIKYIFSLLLLVITTISCSRYEDGPFFSFYTRKARIVNKWQLEEIENTAYGTSWDTSLSRMVWGFEEDGHFWKSDNTTGEWEFLDMNTLKIWFDNYNTETDSFSVYTVSRLTRKQLWMKNKPPDDTVKYHYVPVN